MGMPGSTLPMLGTARCVWAAPPRRQDGPESFSYQDTLGILTGSPNLDVDTSMAALLPSTLASNFIPTTLLESSSQ